MSDAQAMLNRIRANRDLTAIRSERITPNFTWGEAFVNRTDARMCDNITLDIVGNIIATAQRLEEVRAHLGNRPIVVTSWYRDLFSNREVGGASRSWHLSGRAVDFNVTGLSPQQVQAQLEPFWVGGMGCARTFTHLDTRPTRARFGY